jgi:hypothetical protein
MGGSCDQSPILTPAEPGRHPILAVGENLAERRSIA